MKSLTGMPFLRDLRDVLGAPEGLWTKVCCGRLGAARYKHLTKISDSFMNKHIC